MHFDAPMPRGGKGNVWMGNRGPLSSKSESKENKARMENALKAFKNVVDEKLRVLRNHAGVSKMLHSLFIFLKPL